jgi:hypothetical protein
MSNWNFRSIGLFNSEGAVDQWAKENGVNAADVKTSKGADGKVAAQVRESAYDASASANGVFGGYDRKGGFQ